ncbi:mitochondrial inner membrane protein MPV17 [Anticarsia gemmatalis]|uniref:mitochondrial inner membrane protein MPV17 n=1 Tax=Anticarsia gemmatalis TaxID=129554 RepID=UPI003F772AA8
MMRGRGIFKLYQNTLNRRPYLIQAIQAGTLMGAGDLISQTLIEKQSMRSVDLVRSLKFSSIGFFVGGPALRMWYGVLNKHIGSSGKTVVLKKVFVDQVIFAPAFLCTLLVAVGGLQGKDWATIKRELKANYFDVLVTNYYIWPWVQIVNFYYVPLQYQVLVVQTVALFWNTYLAWKTNRKINLEN